MDLLTSLLGINWLEQKSQGRKTRELIAKINQPLSPPPVDRAVIDAHLAKVKNDPKSLMNWTDNKSLFTMLRMCLFGFTKREKVEVIKAYDHECGLGFPK